MRKRNEYNKYPYLLLLVIHTFLLLFTFYKKRDRKTLFISLCSNISLAYYFDYFVVNLWSGYWYKPDILKKKRLDLIVGAIFSQGIFVPFTALFITAFQLGWKIKLVIGLYFSLIERIFVSMGIYTQCWWKTQYTTILLPIYFWICDKWYHHLKKRSPFILFLSFYHLILITSVNILFVQTVKRKVKFGTGNFHHWREHLIIMPLYSIGISLFTAWSSKNKQIFTKGNILRSRLLFDYILIKLKWLKLPQKNVLGNLPFHLIMTILSDYYKQIVFKK
jgi:hypothetical protein